MGCSPIANVRRYLNALGSADPASSIWRQTQHYGERLKGQVEQEQTQVSPERVVLADAAHDHPQRKGISMDGGMVNIRGEGWKEMKAGAVFDIELRVERDARTHEWTEMAHGVNIAYTAVLGSVGQFAPALWALAVQSAFGQLGSVADGAEWIWGVVRIISLTACRLSIGFMPPNIWLMPRTPYPWKPRLSPGLLTVSTICSPA